MIKHSFIKQSPSIHNDGKREKKTNTPQNHTRKHSNREDIRNTTKPFSYEHWDTLKKDPLRIKNRYSSYGFVDAC